MDYTHPACNWGTLYKHFERNKRYDLQHLSFVFPALYLRERDPQYIALKIVVANENNLEKTITWNLERHMKMCELNLTCMRLECCVWYLLSCVLDCGFEHAKRK